MHLYNEMKAERGRICAKIKSLEQHIEALPDGFLEWHRRGNGYRYYWRVDQKREYLSKDKKEIIEALAKKSYMKNLLLDLYAEEKAIQKYLSAHREKERTKEFIIRHPNIEEILRPMFVSNEERMRAWAEADYPSTGEHPEDLIHPGPFGKKYRSKSEASIAYALYSNNVPFRYENDKTINDITYHIDFTIVHPKTGQYVYWEHFGRMGKEDYSSNIGAKLRDFESAGIFPDRNLILTFESKKFPFESWMADEVVRKWFL